MLKLKYLAEPCRMQPYPMSPASAPYLYPTPASAGLPIQALYRQFCFLGVGFWVFWVCFEGVSWPIRSRLAEKREQKSKTPQTKKVQNWRDEAWRGGWERAECGVDRGWGRCQTKGQTKPLTFCRYNLQMFVPEAAFGFAP